MPDVRNAKVNEYGSRTKRMEQRRGMCLYFGNVYVDGIASSCGEPAVSTPRNDVRVLLKRHHKMRSHVVCPGYRAAMADARLSAIIFWPDNQLVRPRPFNHVAFVILVCESRTLAAINYCTVAVNEQHTMFLKWLMKVLEILVLLIFLNSELEHDIFDHDTERIVLNT